MPGKPDLHQFGPAMVCMLGVPFDACSSFLRGPAEAPGALRRVMSAGASNLTAEDGYELDKNFHWRDAGDVECTNTPGDFARIEQRVTELLESGARVLSIGGDHSITFPIIKAYAPFCPDLTLLHLDAHPDLYDELDGNRQSHACPFARIMEQGLVSRLVQIGIRTINAHQQEQIDRFGVDVYPASSWRGHRDLKLTGPLYLSIDIDVLDPAFAPGVSHHEPGGLSVRDVLDIIQTIDVPVVGADIVEHNPKRDINDQTAAVCLKLAKEVSALLAK